MLIALLGLAAAPACVTRVVHQYPAPVAPPPSHYPPGASAEVRLFYDDLVGHGEWVNVDGPGWVWYPTSVSADWRPYVQGRWVYSDYGWTWASEESWGWAAYHYGRWHHAPRYGWVWVPGSEWGPAWVTWHSGGGWTGWAPLPWQVGWRAGVGLDWGHVDVRVAIQPAWWCFVPTRHLAAQSPRQYIAPPNRNVNLIKVTKNVTNYTIVDNRVFNQGVHVNNVSKAAGRPVPQVRVRQADSKPAGGGGDMQDDELVMVRPGLRRGQQSDGPQGQVKRSDPKATGKPAEPARATTPAERPTYGRTPAARPSPRPSERPSTRPPARPPARTSAHEDETESREPESTQDQESAPATRPEKRQTPNPAGPASPAAKDGADRGQGAGHRPEATGQDRGRQPVAEPAKQDPAGNTQAGKPQPGKPQATRPKAGTAKGKNTKSEGKESGKSDDSESDKNKDAAPDGSEEDSK